MKTQPDLVSLIERLDKLIGLLEKQFGEKSPQIPKLPEFLNHTPVDVSKVCQKCGIDLSAVMGYVCSVTDCPTGLGPTMC